MGIYVSLLSYLLGRLSECQPHKGVTQRVRVHLHAGAAEIIVLPRLEVR